MSSATPVRVYEYANCSTCRKALQFLDKNKIPYQRIPIVEQPPGKAELRRMLGHLEGDIRKLFNVSGQVYRELKLSERLPEMPQAEALELLAANGKLVKRPFLLLGQSGAVGFKEEEWRLKLGLKK